MISGERAIRAGASIIVAAFAVSLGENFWYAIPAGLCAVFLTISAVTGWCHTGNRPPAALQINTPSSTLLKPDQQSPLNVAEALDHH